MTSPAQTASAPIELVAALDEEWRHRFDALRRELRECAPEARVAHVGSTSVAGMEAKDVVDVLVGVEPPRVELVAAALVERGFVRDGGRPGHVWLAEVRLGRRSAVLHVVPVDGAQWRDRIAFRDVLRRDSSARSIYLAVKRGAASRAAGWDDYTAHKGATVRWLLERHSPPEKPLPA